MAGRRLILGTLAAGALLLLPGAALALVSEPPGYRDAPFRSPVPATVLGVPGIGTELAVRLWQGQAALFIDVLPARAGEGVQAGRWLPEKPRQDIPGSLWLPNTGYPRLDGAMERAFHDRLAALRADPARRDMPLVFYCLTDCWMSWNAARRALLWGFSPVLWYPAGTDGWEKAGMPLEDALPRPETGPPQ